MQTSNTHVGPDRARATNAIWTKCWLPFLADFGVEDPLLTTIQDKIPILRVFAHRLRDGRLSRSGLPIRAATIRDHLLHVAKTFSELGAPDPRLTLNGLMDPRLTRLYKAYENADPAPQRVKPIPFQVLHHAHQQLNPLSNDFDHAIIDLVWIAVFFLLRPGEYAKSRENTPLSLANIALLIGHRQLNLYTCPLCSWFAFRLNSIKSCNSCRD